MTTTQLGFTCCITNFIWFSGIAEQRGGDVGCCFGFLFGITAAGEHDSGSCRADSSDRSEC